MNKNILISGAGIAGLTLAYWLKKFGFHPTIVEQSPKLREGGYAIDFWGAGFTVAEKMGIVADLNKADLGISELSFVDKDDRRKGGLSYQKIKELMNNRAFTLLRSDLSKAIYRQLDPDIEIIFGNSIHTLEQNEAGVTATFKNGDTRAFHLVIGADGLHSKVRKLTFGEESRYEKYYGYYTASFTIDKDIFEGKSFVAYNVPGKQAAVYSIAEHKTAIFFIFTSPKKADYDHHDVEKQKQILADEFEHTGWRCSELFTYLNQTGDFYFDVVSQIQMNPWSKGRITLVGDAGYCPSLLSGQGSTLAMVGAYILAGELKEAGGDYAVAFRRYEEIFRPFIERKQKIAQNFAGSLVPKSRFGIWVRNTFTNLMLFLPFVSKMFIRQFMDDKLTMKDYTQ